MLQDGALPTVKIKDPHKKRDYVIINESDFNPAVHEKYAPGAAAVAVKAAVAAPPTDGLPAGYELVVQPGGRRKVTVGGKTLKHATGPKEGSDVSFKNEAEATVAAIAHAASVAE